MINISVIVTVYNLEEYIGSCLDSILNQTGVDFEVICIDDASTDKTRDILEEYRKKDTRIKVLRLAVNQGLASARNEGYRHAKGEYLYNIDGDDLLAENALAQMYNCAKKNDLDLLGFSARCFFDDESLRQFGTEDEYVRKYVYNGIYNGAELFALLIKNKDRVANNRVLYCYKRSFFQENNLLDEEGLRYADDSMFAYYITAKRAMCVSNQWYLRRYRRGSTVTSPLKKRYLESMVVLFCAEMKRWRSMQFTDEINRQIAAYFDMRLSEIYQLRNLFLNDGRRECYLEEHPADHYFYKRFIELEPSHLDCLPNTLLNHIREAKTVILYGAGYVASEVAKVLEYNSIFDYRVAITATADHQNFFRGKIIKSIYEYPETENVVIIAAMAEKYKEEVMKTLKDCGFKDVIWISLET